MFKLQVLLLTVVLLLVAHPQSAAAQECSGCTEWYTGHVGGWAHADGVDDWLFYVENGYHSQAWGTCPSWHDLCSGVDEEDVEELAQALESEDRQRLTDVSARFASRISWNFAAGTVDVLTCSGDVQARIALAPSVIALLSEG